MGGTPWITFFLKVVRLTDRTLKEVTAPPPSRSTFAAPSHSPTQTITGGLALEASEEKPSGRHGRPHRTGEGGSSLRSRCGTTIGRVFSLSFFNEGREMRSGTCGRGGLFAPLVHLNFAIVPLRRRCFPSTVAGSNVEESRGSSLSSVLLYSSFDAWRVCGVEPNENTTARCFARGRIASWCQSVRARNYFALSLYLLPCGQLHLSLRKSEPGFFFPSK